METGTKLRTSVHGEQRLYFRGDPRLVDDDRTRVAIVGARKATPYGLKCAEHFAKAAAVLGCTVVTAGAVGIARKAMDAVEAEHREQIAVLAGGLDDPYPAANGEVLEAIAGSGGCLVGLQPDGIPPRPAMFRERNWLLADIADMIVVIECGVPSGTFALCDAAIAMEKPVYAVPGDIFSPASAGTNALIAQGCAKALCLRSLAFLEDVFLRDVARCRPN